MKQPEKCDSCNKELVKGYVISGKKAQYKYPEGKVEIDLEDVNYTFCKECYEKILKMIKDDKAKEGNL